MLIDTNRPLRTDLLPDECNGSEDEECPCPACGRLMELVGWNDGGWPIYKCPSASCGWID